MKNKKIILRLSILIILTSVAFLGCKFNKPTVTSNNVPVETQKPSTNSDAASAPTTAPVVDAPATETALPFKYNMTSVPAQTVIKFNTPWELSPLGNFKATIEGKGEKANEEGYSHIIISDIKSGKVTKLSLSDEQKNQLTAKDLEWIDENTLFVILGQPMGTISMGGKIYKVNISTGEITLYLNTPSSKEEFTAVHKTTTGYSFDKYIYDDDNFTKGHTVSGILK